MVLTKSDIEVSLEYAVSESDGTNQARVMQ
jgi:hypothetical protein